MTGLGSFFQDASSTAGTGAVLGLLIHQVVRCIEFELYMFHFMILSAGSFLSATYAFVQFGELSIVVAFARTYLLASSFSTALLASIAAYRLFFHRCRHFPGPFGAKITRFYAAYLSAKDVQYYKELEKAHAKYGDYVRTGMVVPISQYKRQQNNGLQVLAKSRSFESRLSH
jgi:hypothetical protein